MPRRIRVVTAGDQTVPAPRPQPQVIVMNENPKVSNGLTPNEKAARRFYATTTTLGGFRNRTGVDVMDTGQAQFYSPQLSTDFLEKPQNLRERRAFYRFFYNTNEIIGRAVDVLSEMPMSKIRLVPPKGKNRHQNEYVFRFFETMCTDMKLFKTLIETSHEFNLMGNCCGRGAEIGTPEGSRRADSIKVGDLVLTDKSRYRKVIKTCSRYVEWIKKIRCWKDFRDIPVTGEHPIEILRDGRFVFEKTENLKRSDYVRITWPAEIQDVNQINLTMPPNFKKVDGGYERNTLIKRMISPNAVRAKRAIISWLGSLTGPFIVTHARLAEQFKVPVKVLQSAINRLQKESTGIGAEGYQKGSQVVWFPMSLSNIVVQEEYQISRSKFLPAIDTLTIDDDFCYLAGFWLGDGTLGRDSKRKSWGRGFWQISFSESATENIDRVRSILHKIFGQESINEWICDGMKYFRVNSNAAFIEWWAENFGETTFGDNFKKIPQWLVKLPKEKLQHLLAGLVDSDGCSSVTGPKRLGIVNISMASRPIMNSVRDIAFKCGIVCSYSKTPGGRVSTVKTPVPDMFMVYATDEESCRIFTEYSNKKFPEEQKFSKMDRYWKRVDGKIAFKIRNMSTEKYNDMVFNFEVEEDHTYQVAGFSTHNCFIYAELHDWKENLTEEDIAEKGEEAKQRARFLKEKYDITDKNPLLKGWKKLIILPPDQVRIRKLPLTDEVAVEYMPDPETRRFLTSDIPYDPNDPGRQVKYSIPEEIKERVRRSGVVPMDTDPNTGSHVYHLARKKSQYEPLGVSVIERCVNTLVLMDKLRQAQTSIASRHMTPMRIVWAEQLNDEGVDNLREQVDLALVDPDYSIIANYEIHWEEMGSQGRLLDIEAENESNMNRLFAGMGVTREILTGEGTYTGSRISLEIMNTMFLLFREVIQDYVENYLFKPIARKKGFIEYDEYGNEVVLYPRLSFTRLAIRDNEQFFDSAFQLYQKGSLPVNLLLDILNIDPDMTKEHLEKDLFTVNDSIFNELLRNIYTSMAAPIVEKTDLMTKISKYLKLNVTEEEALPAEGASRFSSVNPERTRKVAKVLKYFQEHPEALDKVFPEKKS